MSVKSTRKLILSAALLFAAAVSAPAQYKPLYFRDMPKVSASYDTVLQKTWEGIKKRNVDAYTTGLVHRPKSNQPHDAVSEGVAYGMFLALYCNDQAYFNKIWNAGEKYMWNAGGGYGNSGNYYDWRVNRTGSKTGTGPASDADQDIALLLIFADQLVKKGIWSGTYTKENGADYETRARSLLGTIRTSMVDQGKYLMPGHWGDSGGYSGDIKNPGYFAPAFYRVFAEFEPEYKSTWEALINGSYELIEKSPGYDKGLLPDWCTLDGTSTGGAGYNAYFEGDALYRDAIRVYWRLATDYLWYKEPRAKAFLDKAIDFLEGLGGAEKANFFDLNGDFLPAIDTEVLGDGESVNITRNRREHSHLTVGMWAAAAIASRGKGFAESYSAELLKFYKPGTDYWGYATDPSGGTEDTLHNEMYFDQFLAWFGASILGGTFTNVWADLKGSVPTGPLAWNTRPPALLPNYNIDASKAPFTLEASFNRSAAWTVTLTHDSTGQTRTFTGSSNTVNIVWYGLDEANAYMTRGWYTLTISAGSLSYTTEVWLGKPYAGNIPNLRESSRRLLVDDFADGDIYPYIGNVWQTFSDSRDGGNSGAVMIPTAASGNTGGQLEWKYDIRTGFAHAFVALEWNCRTSSGEPMDLTGIDSVIITARSKTSAIGASVQLIDTDDPNDYRYFEDSIALTTTFKTYALRLSSANFKQRLDGSGRNFATTLSNMMAIRFHMQYETGTPQSSDAIIVQKIYLAGPDNALSRIYTPPPEPPEYIAPPREPIGVTRRAVRGAAKYSIKRTGNSIRVTLPGMAGANARIVDIRGRTVTRMSVPQSGAFDISVRNLAAGVYFMEVRKHGKAALRVQLGHVR